MRSLPPTRSLAARAAEDLRTAIRDGLLGVEGRLPSEPTLAAELRVSRATLRHAISILEEEGLVSRRQGTGTFVVEQVRQLRNNLNANFGVTDLIEAAGWEPGTRSFSISETVADRVTAARLGVPPRSHVVEVRRVRLADDRPVAFTVDVTPSVLLKDHGLDVESLEGLLADRQSLYRVLEDRGVVVHHGVATIRPAVASPEQARLLDLADGALLLLLDQVDYTADGEAVVLSEEFHVADVLSVQVYRKGPGARG